MPREGTRCSRRADRQQTRIGTSVLSLRSCEDVLDPICVRRGTTDWRYGHSASARACAWRQCVLKKQSHDFRVQCVGVEGVR